jgi:integrase
MKTPTFKQAFLEKYPERGAVIKYYEQATGRSCTWKDFTPYSLNKFRKYMLDESGLCQKSVRRYLTWFSIVMAMFEEEVGLPKNWRKYLYVADDISQNVYLTEEEIARIIAYTPENENEKYIKNSFLLGALTGARHSDYMAFTERNIKDGWLNYVSQKTRKEASIPASPYILKLVREKSRMSVELSDVAINNIIRRIAMKSGITEEIQLYQRGKYQNKPKYEFLASHSARRSFATNLYLRGADVYQIMKLMGHSSTSQTEGYICCGLRTLSPEVMGFFEKY